MAALLQAMIARWTAKSPKTYRIITDVSVGIGIAATIVTLIPISYPAWVLPVTAFGIAFASKFSVDKKNNPKP